MNVFEILLIVGCAAIVISVVTVSVVKKKRGKSSCGCGCDCCPYGGSCPSRKK